MSVAFVVLSALGATVFFHVGEWPVGVLFVALFLVYVCDLAAAVGGRGAGRALGLVHVITGAWLMYLTFAVTVNTAVGFNWAV